MDVILNKAEEKLLKLSADPETRREYEQRAKALSDERSRLDDAEDRGIESGVLKVAQSLLKSGIHRLMKSEHDVIAEGDISKNDWMI